MTTAQKRAALLAMIQAAKTIARDLADDLTTSVDELENPRLFSSDTAACNSIVGAMLPIALVAASLENMRAAAVALNGLRS